MTNRNLPWFFLGAAIVLAVIAIAVSGFEAYHEHPHDPFGHVGDIFEWHFLESRRITIPLVRIGENWGISKFVILELIAAGLIAAIFIPMARRLATDLPRGAWDNAFEGALT